MTRLRITSVMIAGLSLLLLISPAHVGAVPVLDQVFMPSGDAAFVGVVSNQFANFVDQAQTFTVGISGVLSGVEVLVGENTTRLGAIVDIRRTAAGVPLEDDGSALSSVLLSSASIPSIFSFVPVSFSPFGLIVTTGDVLAITLRGAVRGIDDGSFNWRGDNRGDQYLSGQAYFRTNVDD